MERREALKLTATILGGSVIGSQVFLSGCSTPKEGLNVLTEDDLPLLDEIGETILPDSEQSPGAMAAHIGKFMQTMVNDCYDKKETAIFIEGLGIVEQKSKAVYSNEFLNLSNEKRLELLTNFDAEARKSKDANQPHFFTMMKELTILGYFSSEQGATKALRFNPIPGRFEGCLPYNDENAWA